MTGIHYLEPLDIYIMPQWSYDYSKMAQQTLGRVGSLRDLTFTRPARGGFRGACFTIRLRCRGFL